MMSIEQFLLFLLINLIVIFVVSHVCVDPEFPKNQKVGAITVSSVLAVLFFIFGVIF